MGSFQLRLAICSRTHSTHLIVTAWPGTTALPIHVDVPCFWWGSSTSDSQGLRVRQVFRGSDRVESTWLGVFGLGFCSLRKGSFRCLLQKKADGQLRDSLSSPRILSSNGWLSSPNRLKHTFLPLTPTPVQPLNNILSCLPNPLGGTRMTPCTRGVSSSRNQCLTFPCLNPNV